MILKLKSCGSISEWRSNREKGTLKGERGRLESFNLLAVNVSFLVALQIFHLSSWT